MKHKTSKLLSILLAFVMVAGLLPLGQVAYAYSEGDIPGTTGTGTASDPIMVDSFTELRAACGLATFGTDLYIKFEGTTVEETLPFDAPSLTNAISLNTGYVHLILDGSYVFKVNKLGESQYGGLFEVRSGGFLEISGNGKLSFSPMLTGAANAVILVNGGTVEVNSGRLDGHPLNWAVLGRAISYRTGKLTINGGTFTGYNNQSEPDRVDAIDITPPSSVGENYVRINGGSFSASSKNTPTKGCFGLSVWGTSTFNKYEVIKLAGGIFDGIDVDVEDAKIGDILEEGYHTYYANSGNAAPDIEALKTSTEKIKIDKSTYTVTFHANGHGTAPVAQTVDNGKTATKPTDPTETGWIFGGWYKEATCTNAFDFSTPITGDITLFAKWTEAYTVTVNNDGNGTASASPTSGPDGTLVTLTATPNPGYKFKEWIRQEGMLSGGLDVPNATSATTTFTISGYDVKVKATFEEIPSTSLAFTTQPQSGTAKKTEPYTFTWALNDTPDSIHLQRWIPADNMWATGTNLNGLTSSSESFADFLVDGNVSKYRIRATKGSDTIYSNEFTVTWTDSVTPTAPTITTSTLSDGKVGKEYNQTLAATGDTPITWALDSGNLPAGLTLGTDGKISGTPTTAGDCTFAVKATNGAGNATKSFTVTIAPADATTYTVSFNANSGGGTMADVIVNAGEKLTLPECTFTAPEDKEFDKWDKGAPGAQIDVTADMTIKAEWKDKAVTPPTPAVLDSITVTAQPTKTSYTEGETFDRTGMVITAKYSDGTEKPVATFTVSPSGALKPTDTSVTVSYNENGVTKTVTIPVTVTAKPVDPIPGGGGSGSGGSSSPGIKPGTGTPATPPTPVTPTTPTETYNDVKAEDWFHEAIEYVTEKGIMNGTGEGKFDPYVSFTRAMVVTVLYRLEGEPKVSGRSSFNDVAEDQWYTEAIAWGEENEIVNGYGEGKFGPLDIVTREQLATILYRYAGFKGYDTAKRGDLSSYTDAEEIGDWALTAVEWAVAEGLINGRTESTLVPKGQATRAEAATILMRFIKNVK